MRTDFAAKPLRPLLRTLDAKIAKGDQQMQRAKHADRKQETRRKILIGEAAMRAGAAHIPVDEIEAVLAHYVETGGSKELTDFVRERLASARQPSTSPDQPAADTAKGGSDATRRGGAKVDRLDYSEGVLQ